MEIQKHNFKVEKTAKFCQFGNVTSNTKKVWFVLHGYGQLCDYFIRNFEAIANNETVIIAPEGLSRFYQNGFYGRVGATWMTKEERVSDIEDYCNYLDKLYSIILENETNIEVTVLGFSQGGATASRWLEQTNCKIDQLILWSSIFPSDMPANNLATLFEKFNCKLVYGMKDSFFGEEHQNQIQFMNNEHSNIEIITFEGGHEIEKKTLINIYNSI